MLTETEKVETIPVATEPTLQVASLRGWRDSFARGPTYPASYTDLTGSQRTRRFFHWARTPFSDDFLTPIISKQATC